MHTVKIDSKHFVLANGRNESINGLSFPANKKVEFLPTKIANVFPNLEAFSAYACSIREISKENFVGLSKLEFLDLHYNQIKTIRSGTFEGLSSLKAVHLCKFDFMTGNLYCLTTIEQNPFD
jgi:Leucine-rich repeat (LRR) protein